MRSSTYIMVLATLLLIGFVAQWGSVSSGSSAVQQKNSGKMGWNDSRQLRMQAANSDGTVAAAASAADSSSAATASSSSSSAAGRTSSSKFQGVKFTETHPELGAAPQVQHLQPTIHGHMKKQGHLAWEHWSTKRHEARFDHFLSWRMNRTLFGRPAATEESYTCKGADHPTLPFPGCHVFINHK
jgi:hypothetical protein